MLIWVLIVKIMVATPHGINAMPYLAFDNQPSCVAVLQSLPSDTKADCVAFAADVVKPK